MMVEDEFLETAKLFTRHLHIAEYDRLKESIDAKKQEAELARPVVAGAKRSVEGAMKERAKAKEAKQKQAIRDVFISQGGSDEDDITSCRPRTSNAMVTAVKPRAANYETQETDSDDLDARRTPKPNVTANNPTAGSKPQPALPAETKSITSSFARPALPATAKTLKSRSRPSRMTPFDMLDEYALPKPDTREPQAVAPHDKPRSQPKPPNHSSPQTAHGVVSDTEKCRPSLGDVDDWVSDSTVSKEVADRLSKRKAERAKEGGGNGKTTTRLEDIPTFLF